MTTQRTININGKNVLCELVTTDAAYCYKCAAMNDTAICEVTSCTGAIWRHIWRPVGENPPVAPECIAAMVDEAKRPLQERVKELEAVLKLIAENGGKTTDEGVCCNGAWCWRIGEKGVGVIGGR